MKRVDYLRHLFTELAQLDEELPILDAIRQAHRKVEQNNEVVLNLSFKDINSVLRMLEG